MRSVAIIGAGPAGLVTARWLKREGFEPVIFDQGNRLATIFRFADYLKIFFQLQQHTKPLAHEPMVVRQ